MTPPTRRPQLTLTRLEDRDVPAVIQGTAFNDANGNGTRDTDEAGIAGITVYLDLNRDYVLNAGDVSTTTDANGAYSFTGVAPPSAWVQEILPFGEAWGRWVATTPTRHGQSTTDPGATFTFDVGQQFHAYGTYTPTGTQTQVNSTPTGLPAEALLDVYANQTTRIASSAAAGRFVTVWREYHPGGNDRILAAVFDAGGNPVTGELVVDSTAVSTANYYPDPVVAMTGDGRFAVAWSSVNPATGNFVVYARSFAANGSPLSVLLQVTPATSTDRNQATGIGMDSNGNFTVLYQGGKKSKNWGWDDGITGFQRYTASGTPLGSATQVVNASLVNGNSSLAMASDGRFVVTWDDGTVNAQEFNASGKKLGPALVVANGWQSVVTMDASGRFVVTWTDQTQHAQVFNADRSRSGPAVDLGSYPPRTAATFDSAGNVLFVWTDSQSGSEVRVRRLTTGGVLEMYDYVVNTTTDGTQGRPGIAALANGQFVIVWSGNGVSGDQGVFFQQYSS
jgi:hypothetical protein